MASLPPLTDLQDEDALVASHYFSPFAHWLVPNMVLIGQNPANDKDAVSERVNLICKEGKCGTFVSLQAERAPQSKETIMMGGYEDWNDGDDGTKLGPTYSFHVKNAMDEEPIFIQYGIRDEDVAESVESLQNLLTDLKKRVLESNEVLYIHCFGGKGRSGIVAAGLLSMLYPKIDADEVLERTQKYCEMRYKGRGLDVPESVRAPDTESQKDQVREIVASAVDQSDDKCACVIS